MELRAVPLENPEELNLILGQSHFIKTVEDLHETLAQSVPGMRFGIAFCEASGPCLVRTEGNDGELVAAAAAQATAVGAGHVFFLLLRGAFPINVLPAIKQCQEVCSLFCATANPVQILVAETEQGRGVVDGASPVGVETDDDIVERKDLLRRFGYKL